MLSPVQSLLEINYRNLKFYQLKVSETRTSFYTLYMIKLKVFLGTIERDGNKIIKKKIYSNSKKVIYHFPTYSDTKCYMKKVDIGLIST